MIELLQSFQALCITIWVPPLGLVWLHAINAEV
jgi:hypothetical protein